LRETEATRSIWHLPLATVPRQVMDPWGLHFIMCKAGITGTFNTSVNRSWLLVRWL
jgi:hypothetical protein